MKVRNVRIPSPHFYASHLLPGVATGLGEGRGQGSPSGMIVKEATTVTGVSSNMNICSESKISNTSYNRCLWRSTQIPFSGRRRRSLSFSECWLLSTHPPPGNCPWPVRTVCTAKYLSTSSLGGKKALLCSIGRFLWYKHTYHGDFKLPTWYHWM